MYLNHSTSLRFWSLGSGYSLNTGSPPNSKHCILVLRSMTLKKWEGHEVFTLINWIKTLIKEDAHGFWILLAFSHWNAQLSFLLENPARHHLGSREQPLQDKQTCWCSELGLSSSQNCEKSTSVLYKSPSIRYYSSTKLRQKPNFWVCSTPPQHAL